MKKEINLWKDPIVEEVRKVRHEWDARFGFDPVAIGNYYIQLQTSVQEHPAVLPNSPEDEWPKLEGR